jgi:hypothetical protein
VALRGGGVAVFLFHPIRRARRKAIRHVRRAVIRVGRPRRLGRR